MKIPVYELRKVRTLRVSDNVQPARISCAFVATRLARAELRDLDRERVLAIYLNCQLQVVGVETVAIGTETSCTVSTSALFRGALVAGAAAIIVAHNHPSGDPSPSAEDRELLHKVEAAGKVLDIRLLDFLIVTDGHLYSDIDSIREGKDHA